MSSNHITPATEEEARDTFECVRRQEANNRDFQLHACNFGCLSADGECDWNLGKGPRTDDADPFYYLNSKQ